MSKTTTKAAFTAEPNIDLTVNDSNPDLQLVAGSIKGAMKAAGGSSRDLWFVPRDQIRVIEGFNVRIKNDALRKHIRYLATSMKQEGFKANHPLAGYVAKDEWGNSCILLNDGHNRLDGYDLATAEGADLGMLPIVISTGARDIEDLTVSLVTSNTGKPLEPLEKAAVCKRLTLFGWTEAEISERLQISENYVRELLLLIGAPREIRDMVAGDLVSATTAIQALKLHGPKAIEVLSKGLGAAKQQGKAKVTNRFIADPRTSIVRKSAWDIFNTVSQVSQDPAFGALSVDNQKKITEMLKQIEETAAKKAAKAAKAENPSTDSADQEAHAEQAGA